MIMIKNKAQTSMELIMVISAVMFFFLAFLLMVQNNTAEKSKIQRNLALKEEVTNLKEEIYLAHNSLNGYRRNFYIKENLLNGVEYSISINDGMIYAITEDERNSYSISALNVTGQAKKGNNVILKTNNQVFLNQ